LDTKLQIVHVLPAAQPLGGAERYAIDILESDELSSVNQRVAFLQPTPTDAFPSHAILRPVPLIRPHAVASILAVIRARPHIVHGWLLKGNIAAAVAGAVSSSIVVVTSEQNLGHNLTWPKKQLERIVAAFEDVAIANSTEVRDAAVARRPARSSNFRILLPGVRPVKRPPRVELSTCVAVGRLHSVKDYPTALRAWRRVIAERPSARLIIVGDGPERQRLEVLACALSIEHAVRFVGDCDPGPFLYGCDMFLSTARAEGFSRALLEALTVGLPVVATDVGGARDLPPDTILRTPVGDETAIAEAINGLLNDRAAAARMGRIAREVALTDFSLAASHARYHELYQELAVICAV
jgi:glycosyltransferase involved in cell wall biosynthesis